MSATPPLTDPDYATVKALFNELCDLPHEAAQRARLDALQLAPALRDRVLALLARLPQPSALTQRFAGPVAQLLASASGPELAPGDVVGAWRLLSPLGEGGMGCVFLAARDDGHYQQRAALKLLAGLPGEAALAQLAHERQVLASLNHPHIARLLDGGSTPRGRPFFVMEYVDGEPIDLHVRRHGLGLAAILALFAQLCEAVAYAHGQLVLHCDIKPSNVLVGADGRAQLLDFGVAQLQKNLFGAEPAEATEALIGEPTRAATPRYASPEQLAGQPASAASDVYGLGRLLGELLATLPEFRAATTTTTPSGQRPPLRVRELQALLAKACQPDASQRYSNVEALQSELRRFQSGLPLRAMPADWFYAARKTWQRHRLALLAAGLVLALLAGMTLAFTWRLIQERDQAQAARLSAEREAETARRLSEVMESLFTGFDPFIVGGEPKSFASFVDDSRAKVDKTLKDQPEVQAQMKFVLGLVYQRSGRALQAIDLFQQVRALHRDTVPGETAAAERSRAVFATQNLHELVIALTYAGQYMSALPLARESVQHWEAMKEAPPADLTSALSALGVTLTRLGHCAEARTAFERALQLRLTHFGEESDRVASSYNNLALVALGEEDYGQALAHVQRSLAIKLRVLPPKHPYTLNSRHLLGRIYLAQGRPDLALPVLQEALAQRLAVHGERNVFVADTRSQLALAHQAAGRPAQAAALLRSNLASLPELVGADSDWVAQETARLGAALLAQGQRAAAEAQWRSALALQQRLAEPDPLQVALAQLHLGRSLLVKKSGEPAGADARLAEAGPLIEAGAAALRARPWPPGHSRLRLADTALAELARSRAAASR